MKRTRDKQDKGRPDAILSADMHITETVPIARTDDYLAAQAKKLEFLQRVQEQHRCPVIDAGDVFNHWKPSPWLISRAYQMLPDAFFTVPGNHDLPEHSMELYYKSGLAVLEVSGRVDICEKKCFIEPGYYGPSTKWLGLYGLEYGAADTKVGLEAVEIDENVDRKILIMHEMVWPGKKPPYPGAEKEGYSASRLLEQLEGRFDLVLTGHHHTGFVKQRGGTLLVNPGPMMRISADKAEYKPRFYLYYAEDNTVEPVYYPIETGVHDTAHIDAPKERDERLAAYIERMNMEWESGLSFQANLEAFFKRNKVPKKIRDLIWHSLENN